MLSCRYKSRATQIITMLTYKAQLLCLKIAFHGKLEHFYKSWLMKCYDMCKNPYRYIKNGGTFHLLKDMIHTSPYYRLIFSNTAEVDGFFFRTYVTKIKSIQKETKPFSYFLWIDRLPRRDTVISIIYIIQMG